MSANSAYTSLSATTLANFGDEIFNMFLGNHPLLNTLQQAGNVKIVGGGTKFSHPVEHLVNPNFQTISKLGTIATDLSDPISRTEWDVKIMAGSVAISMLDEAMNAGDREKLIDLVSALKKNAANSMTELFASQCWTAAASVGDNDLNSLPQIISSIASTETNALGGISSSTNSYWRPYQYNTTVSAFNSANAGLIAMDTARLGATFGKTGPTCIFTTKDIYTLYQIGLTSTVRYTALDKGEYGFQNLVYGTMPIYPDDDAPAYKMYFVDTNSIRLQVLKQGNMKTTPFEMAWNQLVNRAMMYMFCNLTCGSRRTNAVIINITG